MIAQLLSLTYSLLKCCIYNNLKREISNYLEKFRTLSNFKTGYNTFTNTRSGMRKLETVQIIFGRCKLKIYKYHFYSIGFV